MLSIYKRWRIAKSIESGEPVPRSLAAALEKTPELHAYADSMRRVHEGLHLTDEVRCGSGLAERVLWEIKDDPGHVRANGGTRHRSTPRGALLEPIGLVRPFAIAGVVVLVSGITVLSIRPWSAPPPIKVTGEFSTLISLFEPMGDEGLIGWMGQSLADELDAIAHDAQIMVENVIGGVPGVALIGKNQGDRPG